MIDLKLVGWKKGLETISLIKDVRTYTGASLAEAKEKVDRLLLGETVVLSFADYDARERFRSKAESYGAVIAETGRGKNI